jgi:hypothetical protein
MLVDVSHVPDVQSESTVHDAPVAPPPELAVQTLLTHVSPAVVQSVSVVHASPVAPVPPLVEATHVLVATSQVGREGSVHSASDVQLLPVEPAVQIPETQVSPAVVQSVSVVHASPVAPVPPVDSGTQVLVAVSQVSVVAHSLSELHPAAPVSVVQTPFVVSQNSFAPVQSVSVVHVLPATAVPATQLLVAMSQKSPEKQSASDVQTLPPPVEVVSVYATQPSEAGSVQVYWFHDVPSQRRYSVPPAQSAPDGSRKKSPATQVEGRPDGSDPPKETAPVGTTTLLGRVTETDDEQATAVAMADKVAREKMDWIAFMRVMVPRSVAPHKQRSERSNGDVQDVFTSTPWT